MFIYNTKKNTEMYVQVWAVQHTPKSLPTPEIPQKLRLFGELRCMNSYVSSQTMDSTISSYPPTQRETPGGTRGNAFLCTFLVQVREEARASTLSPIWRLRWLVGI